MLYIMRRTQLYLEDDLWKALHARARRERTSVSELVRQATRDRYMRHSEDRQADMMAAVGIWRDRTDLPDAEEYVRDLRRGTRLKRLGIE